MTDINNGFFPYQIGMGNADEDEDNICCCDDDEGHCRFSRLAYVKCRDKTDFLYYDFDEHRYVYYASGFDYDEYDDFLVIYHDSQKEDITLFSISECLAKPLYIGKMKEDDFVCTIEDGVIVQRGKEFFSICVDGKEYALGKALESDYDDEENMLFVDETKKVICHVNDESLSVYPYIRYSFGHSGWLFKKYYLEIETRDGSLKRISLRK